MSSCVGTVRPTSDRHSRQRGVALLVTLFMLVVVTALGLMTMRSGMLNVAVSTNSQVSTLLLQSADAGITNVETVVNANVPAATLTTGLIGMVINAPGSERVGCVIKTGLQSPSVTANNRCAETDYLSARDAVLVQFAMVNPSNPGGLGGKTGVTYGSDDEATPTSAPSIIRVYSSSVMPSFGSAGWTDIEDCLALNNDELTSPSSDPTVSGCLATENATARTVVQEFKFGYGGYAP